jgi:hypothetical protein
MQEIYAKYISQQADRAREREKARSAKPEKTVRIEPQVEKPVVSRRRATSDDSQPRRLISVPRLKFDKTFHMESALEFVVDCNRFVVQLSDRISELERATSILLSRIDELEKYYGLE